MSFKISCHKKPSPCKIKIKYLHRTKGIVPDLKVYESMYEISPKESKCSQKLTAPSSFTVEDPDRKGKFLNNFNIYLSFYSQEGITFVVSVNFIDKN